MDTIVRILIVVKPGHFRDSLVAVLKTLPRVELFLVNGAKAGYWEERLHAQPALALVDLDANDMLQKMNLVSMKVKWPDIKSIALVNNLQQARVARSQNVDLVLLRSASAGELLSAIQHLSAGSNIPVHLLQSYPASVMP